MSICVNLSGNPNPRKSQIELDPSNHMCKHFFVTLFQELCSEVIVNFDVKLPLRLQSVAAMNILKIHLTWQAFMLPSHFTVIDDVMM